MHLTYFYYTWSLLYKPYLRTITANLNLWIAGSIRIIWSVLSFIFINYYKGLIFNSSSEFWGLSKIKIMFLLFASSYTGEANHIYTNLLKEVFLSYLCLNSIIRTSQIIVTCHLECSAVMCYSVWTTRLITSCISDI